MVASLAMATARGESGSKAARRALRLVAPRRGALQLLLLAAGGPEEGAASRHWGLKINVVETLEGSLGC